MNDEEREVDGQRPAEPTRASREKKRNWGRRSPPVRGTPRPERGTRGETARRGGASSPFRRINLREAHPIPYYSLSARSGKEVGSSNSLDFSESSQDAFSRDFQTQQTGCMRRQGTKSRRIASSVDNCPGIMHNAAKATLQTGSPREPSKTTNIKAQDQCGLKRKNSSPQRL